MILTESPRGVIAQREGCEEFYIQWETEKGINLHDWGHNLHQTQKENEIVLVQFKNARREFYLNPNMLAVERGDIVAVAASPGHDIGVVALTGWLAKRAFSEQQKDKTSSPPPLYRKATKNDLDKWLDCMGKEQNTMLKSRAMAHDLGLAMKISDVEYQGDGTKASFYFSAEKRVDFRELVRLLATEFRVRIEMKQIGSRQEAGKIGGIGTCGKELCCCKWMKQFHSVTTASVKMQDLTPNPQKQAGQCGKLKCCLNFEVDVYEDAKKSMPLVKKPLRLVDCELHHQKSDLFQKQMWFTKERKSTEKPIMLTVVQVEEILEKNAQGELGASLQSLLNEVKSSAIAPTTPADAYSNVVIEEESITRFDNRKRRSSGRQKSRGRRQSRKKQAQ